MQREDHLVNLELTALVAGQAADHAHADGLPERAGRVEAGGGVVVAADDHHVQSGVVCPQLHQGLVVGPQRPSGRVGGLKNVASDQERVDLLRRDRLAEPVEKTGVLLAPRLLMQGAPEVPVRGVQDAHGAPCQRRLRGATVQHVCPCFS
ncbi:MAG: hypothetical protein ACI9U2_001780 [Bradymonadia bacterium]|jgi:hypothetical protein